MDELLEGTTPGPWTVAERGYGWDHFAAVLAPSGIVANCHIAALSRDYTQTAADAKLIAKAPELAARVKVLTDTVESLLGLWPMHQSIVGSDLRAEFEKRMRKAQSALTPNQEEG